LEKTNDELNIEIENNEIFLNANAYGFYKVNNKFENNFENINEYSSEEKYSLIDDYWSMVLNGSENSNDFIEFSSKFSNETKHMSTPSKDVPLIKPITLIELLYIN